MNAEDIKKVCTENGISFVNRSFGKHSTKTISLATIEQIALEFYKLGLHDGVKIGQKTNPK